MTGGVSFVFPYKNFYILDDIIHVLPDSVANQIAAGEVVQRPASIIKEMVENAIDADAQNIQVLVVDGGKTSVQIVDDGKGMSEMDARLSFERHATSKIKDAADLFNLYTMGFRGEALASIAAVAHVELKTRRAEDELGTFVRISGSKVECQEPCVCPVGSNFMVNDLFFNTPVRRRFMKSPHTEFMYVMQDFQKIALVYPDIAFSLHHNGAEVLRLQKAGVRQRILDVFGKKINTDLLPIEVETSIVKVSGYVGKPESAKKKGAHQYFFVNGRYMNHPYFKSAVLKPYENLIQSGLQVPYFIYMSVEPSAIDVNVHPAKTDIKFDHEQDIWQVLSATVREAIGKFSKVPLLDFDAEGKPDIPICGLNPVTPSQPRQHTASYNPFAGVKPANRIDDWEQLYKSSELSMGQMIDGVASGMFSGDETSPFGSDPIAENVNTEGAMVASGFDLADVPEEESLQRSLWNDDIQPVADIKDQSQMFAIGNSQIDIAVPKFQYRGQYIVFPAHSGLLVVDQHRAHVRILFEQNMRCMTTTKRPTQKVLFADVVQFSKAEALVLEEMMTDVCNLGFDLSNLGGGSFSINGVPAGIEGVNVETMLHDMISEGILHTGDAGQEARESLALTMAKHSAIAVGQVLSIVEMDKLVADLFSLSSSARTPDGKPIYAIVNNKLIEAMF